MTCATVGELRAYLDGELPGEEMDRLAQHLASCVSCDAELEGLRVNATVVRAALDLAAPSAAEAPAPSLSRIRDRLDGRENHPVTRVWGISEMVRNLLHQATASRARLAASAVALFVAMTLLFSLTPVQTAASSFLSVFRVTKFVAVTVDPTTLPNLKSLSDLGSFSAKGSRTPTQMPLAQAESTVGFKVPTPTALPSGLEKTPRSTSVTGAYSVTFTPDLKKIRAYLASIGASNVKLPDNLDGQPITVQVQPAVAMLYTEPGALNQTPGAMPRPQSGGKYMYVGATTSPTINVPDGVDVNQVRAALLSIPSLPPDLVNQLKSITDWQNTVIVPVVKGTSRDVTVQGTQGVLVTEDKGPGLTLLWQKSGIVYVVSGDVSESELLAAANSMN